ncbi:C2 domain-containing protein [Entamoeba marina]
MDIEVVLENYGIAGVETIGYLDVIVHNPQRIKNVFVKLTLNSTIYLLRSDSIFFVHEYNRPTLTPGVTWRNHIDKQDIECFECIGFNDKLDTEYPPGNYQFPFCFTLPKYYQPKVSIPEFDFRTDYSLTGVIDTVNDRIVGSAQELPILYNMQDIPNEIQNKTTKFADDFFVELTQPKQTYVQGETIDAILSVKSYKKSIPELEVLVKGVYQRHITLFNKEYSSFCLAPSVNGYTTPIKLTLPNTIPPTISASVSSWNYYIVVKSKKPSSIFKLETVLMYFPIKVITPKPSSTEMIQEYVNFLNTPIKLGLDTIFTPPNYIFQNQTSSGTELVEMVNSKSILLDHVNRKVFEVRDKEVILSTMHYPFIESTTLSPGLTYETVNGRECIIDHVNKKGCWSFEQKTELQTQAQKCNCPTPIVSIELLEGKKLKLQKKKSVSTFCYVENEMGECLKTQIDMPNHLFKSTKFVIFPPKTKSNVVIYFCYKKGFKGKKLIGFINLDLTKIPFHSYFEKWYSIQPVTRGDDYFTGKIKLIVGYDEKINSVGDSLMIINEIKKQKSGIKKGKEIN